MIDIFGQFLEMAFNVAGSTPIEPPKDVGVIRAIESIQAADGVRLALQLITANGIAFGAGLFLGRFLFQRTMEAKDAVLQAMETTYEAKKVQITMIEIYHEKQVEAYQRTIDDLQKANTNEQKEAAAAKLENELLKAKMPKIPITDDEIEGWANKLFDRLQKRKEAGEK